MRVDKQWGQPEPSVYTSFCMTDSNYLEMYFIGRQKVTKLQVLFLDR